MWKAARTAPSITIGTVILPNCCRCQHPICIATGTLRKLPVAHCLSATYGPHFFQYLVRSLSSFNRFSSSVRYSWPSWTTIVQVGWTGGPCDERQLEAAVIRSLVDRGRGQGGVETTEKIGDRNGGKKEEEKGSWISEFCIRIALNGNPMQTQPWPIGSELLNPASRAWLSYVGQMEGQNATQNVYSGCATSWACRWWFARCSYWCLIGATTVQRRYKWR